MTQLDQLQADATDLGRACIVNAIVLRKGQRIFALRRSYDATLFPGCWDLPGGKVEKGESLISALARELHQETGWTLRRVIHLVKASDWQDEAHSRVTRWRQFDFAVIIEGDFDNPELEPDKHVEWQWLQDKDCPLFLQNRHGGDQLLYEVVTAVYAMPQLWDN